jgi:branched-chain amino acid transport system permease protein
MSDFFAAYRPLIELFLLHTGYAFSQYIVLRAGVFSVANAGFAAIGAYLAAILTVRYGLPAPLAVAAAVVAGIACALLLSWPLARLRGVYQAIATLAFVQIVLSLNLYAEDLTGGAMGFNGIPKVVGTGWLVAAVVLVVYAMHAINSTRIGRAFEAVRQDEAMAASLGVSVRFHQALAFAVSGAIAGLFGALEAFHSYALEPNQFGFAFLVAGLSYVVLGGRRSIWGPVVGTAVLVALPELARSLAENRILVYGLLLIAVINFLPRGIVDTALSAVHRRRMAAADARLVEARP